MKEKEPISLLLAIFIVLCAIVLFLIATELKKVILRFKQEAIGQGYAERVVSDDGTQVIWRWKSERMD